MNYVVLVADTPIDSDGHAEPEVIGPFPTEDAAQDWAYREQRYIADVIPLTYRQPS